ncbi:unannotated protein [freshwater metagenome]|uniref:Thiamine pyrimidine synthase n=1 Tax=freshwater metagenome TaxID=449393 RepID=A0A6J7DW67_9ZZZZ|nr:hypothetical protein [Actinomycetota bacterium]
MSSKYIAAALLTCSIVTVSCSSSSTTTPATVPTTAATSADAVVAGKPFPTARCDANKAAGKITYLSSFDFAAAASIVEVLVAKQKGYFDALCLNVEIKASFSTANYPLIAGNQAQFSSGGSFSEVAGFANDTPDADILALAVEGKTAIDALIVKADTATTVADLKGTTIGVKGKITPSVQAMLAKAGLIEGTDYQTVPVEGYDPKVHIAIPSIVGFPGYKSNEPGQLDRAGISYSLFDPSANGIPGSFGILYTNRAFMTAHPSATEDFMRAAMMGLADAIADPAAASKIALSFIDSNGNPNYLSPEGETYRWLTESQLITNTTPAGEPVGLPDAAGLQAEVEAYATIGLFGGKAPDISKRFDSSVLKAVYAADRTVIWPSS